VDNVDISINIVVEKYVPSGTVDKIMGGNLMVKNGTKKNTNSNIA
jgi:hypothetical protein